MPLLEAEYCIEQINVPPCLPHILKQFCKSAIRTQPYDLLKWSQSYFHALSRGEEPPAKLRLEYPPACSARGLTLGFLKVLLRQLGADYNKVLPLECILERWDQLCLDRQDADLIIQIGKFRTKCQVKKFLSIGVGLLTRKITETMIKVCELFTHEPDGGSAMIPLGLFMEIYGYLAGLRCDGSEKGIEDLCLCSDPTQSSETLAASQQAPEAAAEPVSVASQDTEADIDLKLESLAKDDAPSETTLQSFGEEEEGSYCHEGEASYRSVDRMESSERKILEGEEGRIEEYEKSEMEMREEYVVQSSTQSLKSQKELSESTGPFSNPCESLTNPDVAGIGRRLLADEVATVAIWMSDCARRQGGMVGPRNIRHINCPPLEGGGCPRMRSCENFLHDK